MLKINNINSKKYKVPLFLFCLGISGIFLFQYLMFIPEYSSAEEISTPVYGDKEDTRTLSDITYMQEMTSEICTRSDVGEEKLNVVDQRDESVYSIKKLNDQRCWMTRNLRIVDTSITSNDSDISEGMSPYSVPTISTTGSNTGVFYYGDINYGAYYAYNIATAGTNPSGENEEAQHSVCPRNWRLPTRAEYDMLISKGNSRFVNKGMWIGGAADDAGSAFFPANGYIHGSGPLGRGSDGNYWSSTARNSNYAYNLYFGTAGIAGTYADDGKAIGRAVRCVTRDDVPDVKIPEIPNPNISVTVDKILTMEIADKEVNIEPKTNEVMTGSFTTTVSSNAGYDIGLSAAEGSPIALVNKKDNVVIAEIPASNNIQVGNNGWGIKCTNTTNCIDNNYHALTTNLQTYFTTNTGAINQPTNFQVGIGISPDLPSGTYSTSILVTASQK